MDLDRKETPVAFNPPRQGARVPLAPLLAVGLGAAATLALLDQPPWLVGVPTAVIGAVLTSRFPVATLFALFALTGMIGTLTAFTPLAVVRAIDLVLLWTLLGVVGTYFFTRPARRAWLWPGIAMAALYLLVSALQVFLADPVELGFYSFRASSWYMMAVLVVGLAPWPAHVFPRAAKAVVVVALVVGAYGTFRWLTGVNADEYAAQRAAAPRLDDRFAASFLSANQLAAWAGVVIPFCLAMLLVWRGRWRILAIGAIGFLAVVLLASDVRGGVAAAAVGVLAVLLVHQLSPAIPGRVGVGLLAVTLVAAVGVGGYAVAVEGSPRAERLESLLEPSEDITYQERLQRWEVALDVIGENPLGLGLGTVGEVAVQRNEAGSAVSTDLDSSYLKIALEQGIAVFLIYALALLLLVAGLAARALSSAHRLQAGLAIGGVGALASLMVLFYSGLYVEGATVVAAWLLVAMGMAAVTMHDVEDRPPRGGPT